jgi:signal transduction histidine kinase/CheY-like chemotaxis protein/HPt (histidine-containing phosphotransfer) domain-containing protein
MPENDALSPEVEDAASVPMMARGRSRRMWWGLAGVALLAIISGATSYLYLMQTNRGLARTIKLQWPLERSLKGLEAKIEKTALAVHNYVNEQRLEDLKVIQENTAGFQGLVEALRQSAEHAGQRELAGKVMDASWRFKQSGDIIVAFAGQRHAARAQFRDAAWNLKEMRGRVGRRLGATGLDRAIELGAGPELRSLLDTVVADSAMYVAAPDPALRQSNLEAIGALRVFIARHRTGNASPGRQAELRQFHEQLANFLGAADEIMTITDGLAFHRRDFGQILREIGEIIEDEFEPLFAVEREKAEEASRSGAADAVLAMTAMVVLGVLAAGLLTAALSRAGAESRTAELRKELIVRKKSEQRIEEARAAAENANRAKSVFLATMSHEIRTPLNGIIGMIDLMEHTSLNADQAQMVRTVNVSAYALLNIIGDILDFSKIEAGELSVEHVDMSISSVFDTAMETLSQLAESKNIDLVVFVNPEAADRVKGDPVRIRQILFNLVGNAIKFSAAADGSRRAVIVRADPGAGRGEGKTSVRFTVTDSGIGISEENLARLFTPFFQAEASTTRRFGGSGLGLSICKKLVNLMGGDIGVKSKLGEGTTFTFEIPFANASGAAPGEDSVDLTGVRALLAFDDSLSHFAASTYLMYSGAAVVVADDIADAKRKLMAAAENKRPYDAAIFYDASPKTADAENQAIMALRDDAASLGTGFVILTADRRHRSLPDLPKAKHVLMRPLSRTAFLRAVAAVAGKADAAALERDASSGRAQAASGQRGERILLAEDNAINQLVIQRQLRHLGFDAEVAADGKEALRRLGEEKFDLLMTDCHMPGMDGFELAEAIRKRERESGARLPIVAITANALRGDAERCLAVGMDDFLSKPVALHKMSETLEKWLGARETRHGAPAAVPAIGAPDRKNETIVVREAHGGAEAATSNGPVDLALLGRLIGTHEPDELRKIVLFFWETTAQTPAELRQHFNARNAKLLRDAAHAAKGASAAVGAVAASELLKKLQFAAGKSDWSQVAAVMPAIDEAFMDLKHYVGTLEGGSGAAALRAASQA